MLRLKFPRQLVAQSLMAYDVLLHCLIHAVYSLITEFRFHGHLILLTQTFINMILQLVDLMLH